MSGSSNLESLGRVGLWTLPRVAWIIFTVLILVWVMNVEGGLGFTESSVFGWHAFLMTLAFVVFLGEAVLIYHAPLLFFVGGPVKKYVHIVCHLATLVCVVLALVAIAVYKRLSPQPIAYPFFTLYSPHSWMGIVTLILWTATSVTKLLSYVLFSSEPSKEAFGTFHRYLGLCTFVSGLATCALGLQDMQGSDLAGLGYDPYSMDAQLSTAATVMLLVFGMAVFAALSFLPRNRWAVDSQANDKP